MTTGKLATFGRRTFFVGAVYFAVLSTLWRIFDWPEWFGALVAFGGGTVAFWAIDRLAARMAPVDLEKTGRCGQSINPLMGAARLVCALPAGHAGWHRDDNHAEWGPMGTTP